MASTSFNKTQRKSSKDTPTNKSIWFAKDYDDKDSKFGEIILEEDKERLDQDYDKPSMEDQLIKENNGRKPKVKTHFWSTIISKVGERPRVDRKGDSYEKCTTTRRGKGRESHGSTRANIVQAGGGGICANTGTSDSNVISLPGLNSKQWETLLQMLKNGSRSIVKMNGKYIWIIDSGASHHMTGMIEELFNLKEIVQCSVELPDGNIVVAKKKGDVRFDNGFILKIVLYVPGLTCNLLSVLQLLDEGNCIIQFASNICVIHDLTSRTVIGAGERRDGGLFYFREVPTPRLFKMTTTTSIPFDLWHKRLGHPSLEVLKFIPQVNINKRDRELSQNCDVCHRAKQCREKFPSSDNKATFIYELIHCDIWGPYKTVSSCGASYFLTIVDDLSRSV
ncbi:retrovirus-related pol polyprotein from transposon TNT 1-94 [Tanacetum coccineum]